MRRKIRSNTGVAKSNQPLGGRPSCLLEREGLVSEDLKSVRAPKPLGQKLAVWIRTCNLSLTKRNALANEPRLRTGHEIFETLRFMKLKSEKENCNPETMLEPVVATRQLWRWVPPWRYGLGLLMRHVCNILIYHPAKSQYSIMIWRCCSRP